MTDNEIIKALPTVAYGGHSCNKCKYKHEKGECRCGLKGCRITRNALDLIYRQKAEIERLRNIVKDDLLTAKEEFKLSILDIAEIRAEAIKEFDKQLWQECVKTMELDSLWWLKEIRKQVLKEMVGDDK